TLTHTHIHIHHTYTLMHTHTVYIHHTYTLSHTHAHTYIYTMTGAQVNTMPNTNAWHSEHRPHLWSNESQVALFGDTDQRAGMRNLTAVRETVRLTGRGKGICQWNKTFKSTPPSVCKCL